MRNCTWTLAGLAAVVVSGAASGEDQAGAIEWAASYDAAIDRAKAEHRLVLIDFDSDGCSWCRRLDASTFPDPLVVAAAERFVLVKVPAQRSAETYEKYADHVQGFPTILFVDPARAGEAGGGVVGKIGGYMPAAPFAARMRAIADAATEAPALRKRIEATPEDVAALGRLALILSVQGEHDEAVTLLKRADELGPGGAAGALAPAYNAVADGYQARDDYEAAVRASLRAAELATEPGDAVYARLNAGFLLGATGKDDEGLRQFEAMAATPGISEAERALAQQMIDGTRKALGDRAAAAPDASR